METKRNIIINVIILLNVINHPNIIIVMGMNPAGDGLQVVEAEVPFGEMSSYAIDLRSMTQGRGSYSMNFVRYEEVPVADQAKIIEAAKAEEDE